MVNLNRLKEIYVNSPMWMKNLYSSIPFEVRNGKDYRDWKLFLENELNEDEYQLLKLKETLFYAYENVLYYKKIFNELDCSISDFNTLSDIEKLPLIDKEIVRENFNDFIAHSYSNSKSFYVTTGGTSGNPMKFFQSNNVWKKEIAFIMHYFSTYGYQPFMIKASFRAGVFNNLPKNIFWKTNPINHEIQFSPFHINEENIIYYVNHLNRYKIEYFHAYPSSILILIEHMKNKNLYLNYKLKAIFLISENFSVADIEIMKSFFQCNISSFYGHSERLVFAPTYAKNLSSNKINKRYGYFELIDSNNKVIVDNNQRGEIVSTSYDNYAMPLIRYKTNDFTHYIDSENSIINMIEGRWDREYLLGKNGLKISVIALSFNSAIFKNIMQYQFHQKEYGKVEFYIIVKDKFQNSEKESIRESLNTQTGDMIKFEIKVVDRLELTMRGKFKKVINKI
jgi:phenylacetate-CoA ligase